MIFRHFTLPKKVASQAMAFSWMAEETLIGDVDNLHWTVLHKKAPTSTPWPLTPTACARH